MNYTDGFVGWNFNGFRLFQFLYRRFGLGIGGSLNQGFRVF